MGPKGPPPATPAGRLGNAPIFVDRRWADCRPPHYHLAVAQLNEQRQRFNSLVTGVPATPPLDAGPPAAPPAGVPAATPQAGVPANAAADGPLPLALFGGRTIPGSGPANAAADWLPRLTALGEPPAPGTELVERLLWVARLSDARCSQLTVEAAEAAAAEAADAAGTAGAPTRGPSSGSSTDHGAHLQHVFGNVFISTTFTDHRAMQLHAGLRLTVEAAVDAIGDAIGGTTRVLLNSGLTEGGLTDRGAFESMTDVAQNLLANIFCAVAPTAATLRRLRTP